MSMKEVGATTIWVWWCVMLLFGVMKSSATMEEFRTDGDVIEQANRYTTVTYSFDSGTKGYEQFLNTLRNTIKDTTKTCNIFSTKRNPSANEAYVLVKLQASSTQWVTLGIEAKNLYLWAYQNSVKKNGKYQAFYLKDAPTDNIFDDSEKTNTHFGSNYISLEGAAKTTREKIPLTLESLKADVLSLYGDTIPAEQKQAAFFLKAIQIIPEATRFRILQKAIRDNTATPSSDLRRKLLDYENNWDNISQKIYKASPKCQEIVPPLKIGNMEVNDVNEIKDDMGLLKYRDATETIDTVTPLLARM